MVDANRREFLALAGTGLRATVAAGPRPKPARLLIDTHLEVWTLDPRYPFRHPERPNLRVDVGAPIENQVAQMKDYGLKYAVLINPRYYGWDNRYIRDSLRRHPKLFVAHGLINPEDPRVADRHPRRRRPRKAGRLPPAILGGPDRRSIAPISRKKHPW
jgi:predicted TIM-barrel fold metal-dependent hydrolase